MIKRLTSFILVLALSFSLFSVSASAEFTSSDSSNLSDIRKVIQYLQLSPSSWQRNSVIGFLDRILDALPSNLSTNFALQGGDGTNVILDDVRKLTMSTYDLLSSKNIAGNIGLLSDIKDYVFSINRSTEYSLSSLISTFTPSLTPPASDSLFTLISVDNGDVSLHNVSFGYILSYFLAAVSVDLPFTGSGGSRTLYGLVSDLANTLASEADCQLADKNKENRDQVENDFLTGQSGSTSLGKGDFSNASQVGGALSDTFNMGGASKVSDFLSGFGSAGTESQAWFSQTTANNLNAVEASDGTSGVSSFADDGVAMDYVNPDPYNMGNIFERYDWLEGVNMDG